MAHRLVFIFSLLTLLSGCQILPPYTGPITPTPDHWKNSDETTDAEEEATDETPQEPCFEDVCQELGHWWEIFNDCVLNQLEEQALHSSYTLWAALERVIEARAQARISRAALWPSINFDPYFMRNGSLIQNPLTGLVGANPTTIKPIPSCQPLPSISLSSCGLTPASSQAPSIFRFTQTQFLLPLDFNYEVDLWSRLNNAYYAALIRAQAASQAYFSVLLSLTADVASNYFQLRGLDLQQEVIQKNIRVRKNAVDINRTRFNAGLINYLDVSRAELELATAHADSDNVRRLRGIQENILATLVGVPASVFSVEYDPLSEPPPVIPTGIPSELLCRRPDIGEAERQLAAAHRDIGVAYANFFPSLSLNAALGVESPVWHNLLSWKARFWEVGLNIMQTVFDAGGREANLDYYRARFQEAMANYQGRVLIAFQDVENALISLRENATRSQDLAVATRAAQQTLLLSQMRYNRGLVYYLDVVDAERSLLQTEQTAAIVLGDRYYDTVFLIRALGGGWGPCDP